MSVTRGKTSSVAGVCLIAVAASCWLYSIASGALPRCNNRQVSAHSFCGTRTDCPNTTTNCFQAITVIQEPNFTPCTDGTDSTRCEVVENFTCTKSWYCTVQISKEHPNGICVKSTNFPKDGNGDQVISTDTSGKAVSCARQG